MLISVTWIVSTVDILQKLLFCRYLYSGWKSSRCLFQNPLYRWRWPCKSRKTTRSPSEDFWQSQEKSFEDDVCYGWDTSSGKDKYESGWIVWYVLICFQVWHQRSAGFPWDQKELRYYGTYYGFPTTLKENAIRAHKYLFGTSDYQVSDELSRINQKIIYRAGY